MGTMRRGGIATILFLIIHTGTAAAHHPSAGFGQGTSGPITTISATPVPANRWSFDLRADYLKFKRMEDSRLEELAAAGQEVHSIDDERSVFFSAGYGFTDDLSLGFHIPYISRRGIREGHLEAGTPEVHVHGDSEGIGDLTLLGTWRFSRQERAGADVALLFGLKLPTGSTDEKDRGGERFATEFQPGSGSWDPLIGVAASRKWRAASLDGSLLYTVATKGAQDTDLGDMLHFGAALSRRLVPGHSHTDESRAVGGPEHGRRHSHMSWDFILEATGDWKGKQTVRGIKDENSGGTMILISPGVRMNYYDKWSVYLSAGVPILQDWNGTQHDASYRVLLGFNAGL